MNRVVNSLFARGFVSGIAVLLAASAGAESQRASMTISGNTEPAAHASMTISGSGGGLIIVKDTRSNRQETIDQNDLRLNTPSKHVQDRVQALKDKQQADADAVLEARKEKQRLAEEAAAAAAEKAKQEAEAAANAARLDSYKAYEEALALPPRDRRTGRFRVTPEMPDGYTTDWRNAES